MCFLRMHKRKTKVLSRGFSLFDSAAIWQLFQSSPKYMRIIVLAARLPNQTKSARQNFRFHDHMISLKSHLSFAHGESLPC